MIRIFIFGLLTLCVSVQAEDAIQVLPGGEVNWSQGLVKADGYGIAAPDIAISAQRRLLSRRAAIVDAQRNLLEITKGVRITSMTKVSDMMVADDITATRVQGVIKGAVVVKENYQNDVYSVTMMMPLGGKLLQAVYKQPEQARIVRPEDRFQLALRERMATGLDGLLSLLAPRAYGEQQLLLQSHHEAETVRKLLQWIDTSQPADVATSLSEALGRYESGALYSGVLIDASAVSGFEIATVPNIRDENGDIIYPTAATSFQDIIEKRGVTYDLDLEDAIRNERVATSPFIIGALGTYKNQYSDLVISNTDAARIASSPSTLTAMNKTGVLIVVGI